MKHAYLTETEIRKSLAAGAITDKEAKELIVNVKLGRRGDVKRKRKAAVLKTV